ncbi:hypothetical protein X975_19561, partial [Stegodyphus mimosarum]
MDYIRYITQLCLLLAFWRTVISQDQRNDNSFSASDKDTDHEDIFNFGKNGPDMRLVLNGLLRYENAAAKRLGNTHSPFVFLSSRSKGPAVNVHDPLAVLATGFMGSRGKRTDNNEIPVFANGFPAGRG